MSNLTLALPSKGRLREQAETMFARAGFDIVRIGSARGYRGEVKGLDGVDVAFLSATEIAQALRDGTVDLGVTGEEEAYRTLVDTCSALLKEQKQSSIAVAELDYLAARIHALEGRTSESIQALSASCAGTGYVFSIF